MDQVTSATERVPSPPAAPTKSPGLKFAQANEFQVALKRRVDEYFAQPGKRRRDNPLIYVKAAIILGTFASSYALLVFVVTAWWLALPLAILLGLAIASIGLNIQHDGGHSAFSERPWINKSMAMTLDLVGGSSYNWHWKHGVLHHTYVNITGHDSDIDLGALARFSPHQKRHAFHRFQHLYIWPLYGFMAIKWHLIDDFKEVITGRIGDQKYPRPKGWDLAVFVLGKIAFFSLALVIPLLFHSFWAILLYYGIAAVTAGIVLSVVFQLAHCVEEAEFPIPEGDPARMASAWAVHQAETTVDFGRGNRLMAWLLGGLNFQVEHHLLPRICHVNFPELSKIVEQTCREYGVTYNEHRTFAAGLKSHYRWLREMGRPVTTDAGTGAPTPGAGTVAMG